MVRPTDTQTELYQSPEQPRNSPGTVQDAWRLRYDYLRLLILWEIGYTGTYQPLADLTRWAGNTPR